MNKNLTRGNITSSLIKLALPIMGTSLMNMFYGMTDMMWLGRLSTEAVAAVSAAHFFIWFGSGFAMLSTIGMTVGVSHSYGRDDLEELRKYFNNIIKFNIVICIFYTLFLFKFDSSLIGIFNLDSRQTINDAISYLNIVGLGVVFLFSNMVLSAAFNGTGNSMIPFFVNGIGLVVNIVLDPILIFGLLGLPKLGVIGAAIATVTGQIVVTTFFIFAIIRNRHIYGSFKLFEKIDFKYIKKTIKVGSPAFFHTAFMSSISMALARILSIWGSTAIGVQSLGAQIESISWMTAEGFSTAIASFVGQNYGAGNYKRLKEGYKVGYRIIVFIGIFSTILFFVFARPIFTIFTPNDIEAINMGTSYLKILSYSQIFMCMEIAAIGAFNGLGRTLVPSIVAILLNSARIPLSLVLAKTGLGLDGVWWAITSTSILKGIVLTYLIRKELSKFKEVGRYASV